MSNCRRICRPKWTWGPATVIGNDADAWTSVAYSVDQLPVRRQLSHPAVEARGNQQMEAVGNLLICIVSGGHALHAVP